MNEFVDFLFSNWKLILVFLLSVACLLATIFKKKAKIFDTIKEVILERLPAFIALAESSFSVGSEKKEFVVNSMKAFLESRFGVGIEDYDKFISDSIEKILATPEKKVK